MSYVKQVVCGRDLAIGYQSINQMRDNADAQYTAFAAHHGTFESFAFPPFAPPPLVNGLGHHYDERIARDSVRVTNRTSGGFRLVDQSTSTCIGAGILTALGLYTFPITGLKEFWAEATPHSPTLKFAVCSVSLPYLQVQIYNTGAGLNGVDCDFTLTLYGNP